MESEFIYEDEPEEPQSQARPKAKAKPKNCNKKKNFHNKINPSTKTFQALRIFVNKEISELINGIIYATRFLKPGGKILILSFHSIEDKIIKYFFSNFSKNKARPSRYLPENNYDKNILF